MAVKISRALDAVIVADQLSRTRFFVQAVAMEQAKTG